MKLSTGYLFLMVTFATAAVAYPARLVEDSSLPDVPADPSSSSGSQDGTSTSSLSPPPRSDPTTTTVEEVSSTLPTTEAATSAASESAASRTVPTRLPVSTEWSRPSDTPSTEVSSGPASTETQTPAPSDTPGSTATVTTDAPTSSSSNPADQSTSETAPASLTTDSHPSSTAGTTSSVSSTASLPTSTPVAPQVDPQVYLDAHNDVRRRARVSDLEWSNDLQGKAQAYANQCQLKHSDGSIGPFGENLAAATGTFGARRAVALFVKDKAKLSLRDFAFTHYTQVIWKSTTQLGCGVALCDNMFSGRAATYHVCLYDPVGNIVGEEEQNLNFD